MTITDTTTPAPDRRTARPVAVRLSDAERQEGAVTTLQPTSLAIGSGQVVGIAGGSGAGKTTLLETMAGVRTPTAGSVVRTVPSAFVPQDDIIHRELPLRRTLEHAASLRLVGDAAERIETVDRVLARLDLTDQADVPVADLSGGQRKRASLAAEMLLDPRLFFLDEPTSGLDPVHSAELMESLRDLAATGATVVVSTHSPTDLARCDQIVFVAAGGRVAFVGSPDEARSWFGVVDLAEVYRLLDDPAFAGVRGTVTGPEDDPAVASGSEAVDESQRVPSAGRQLRGLVARNVDLIRGNRLTLAILLGSPVFIISTMATLFPTDGFGGGGSSVVAVQILFWMAFNSFFFGLTYGLLQIVGEFEIVRRERRAGVRLDAYVASKLVVLVPLLAVVNAAQLGAMELAGRLPDLAWADRTGLFVSLQLLSIAAVAIGLHASASVQSSSQATLALPMLCFPQVLFAGAVVPISEMGRFAEAMSMPLAVRWGFEPLGRILDLDEATAGEAATAGFVTTFSGSPTTGWIVLGVLTAVAIAATVRTLSRRTAAR
ncbi:MAG: ABC transporter ATP-binding protein [Actinomycetota bacterium]